MCPTAGLHYSDSALHAACRPHARRLRLLLPVCPCRTSPVWPLPLPQPKPTSKAGCQPGLRTRRQQPPAVMACQTLWAAQGTGMPSLRLVRWQLQTGLAAACSWEEPAWEPPEGEGSSGTQRWQVQLHFGEPTVAGTNVLCGPGGDNSGKHDCGIAPLSCLGATRLRSISQQCRQRFCGDTLGFSMRPWLLCHLQRTGATRCMHLVSCPHCAPCLRCLPCQHSLPCSTAASTGAFHF